jgi:GT2 family glycosyltransferase
MTSFLTTGGIRGGKASVTSYQPRGFNMGMSAALFKEVGGYDEEFVCGEDVELSLRLQKAGAISRFIPQAHVYHKRRATLKQFRRQVFRFGAARPLLAKAHPGNLKITHLFPTVFTLYRYASFLLFVLSLLRGNSLLAVPFLAFIGYLSAVFVEASRTENVKVAVLAIRTTITMNAGYGMGFLRNYIEVYIKGNSRGIKL